MIDKSMNNPCPRNHGRGPGLLAASNLAMDTTVRPFADNLVRLTIGAGNRVGYLRDVCKSVVESGVDIVECSLDTEFDDWGGVMLLEATPDQGVKLKAALDEYTKPQEPPPAFVPGGRWIVRFCGRNKPGLLFEVTTELANEKWQLNILRLKCQLIGEFAAFYFEVEWEENVRLPPPAELEMDLQKYGLAMCREMRAEDDPQLLWLLDQPLDSLPHVRSQSR
jgi:glycine cleavage system regulatory protein